MHLYTHMYTCACIHAAHTLIQTLFRECPCAYQQPACLPTTWHFGLLPHLYPLFMHNKRESAPAQRLEPFENEKSTGEHEETCLAHKKPRLCTQP